MKKTTTHKNVHSAATALLKEELSTLHVYVKMQKGVKELIFYSNKLERREK